MLINFHSKAAASITLFGESGLALLKLMGLSGTVPSALRGQDVSAALAKLREGLKREGDEPSLAPGQTVRDDDQSAEPIVHLRTRALPLINLLERAARANADVMWDND